MKNIMKFGLYALLILGIFNLSSCLKNPAPDFDYLGQFKKDTAAIKSYLKDHNIQAVALSQGIWLTLDATSKDLHPTYYDTISVTYKMRLMSDGSIVGQSNGAELWHLSDFIPGIQIAMPKYANGSAGHIYIPSWWAYQNIKTSAIPANSNLIFEFTIDNVLDHQLELDTATIRGNLKSQNIPYSIDESGLLYNITHLGSGIKPSLNDSVKVTYTSKFFPDGNPIEQHTIAITKLITDFPIGATLGLMNMPEGSTADLYLPSSLAYGPDAQAGIPGKSNIVYSISLIKVIPR